MVDLQDDLEEDQLISGKFRVLDLVGRDRNANSYNVQASSSQEVLTVRVFHVSGSSKIEELKREIELLKRLDHPNIAKIKHQGILPDGRPYMLLESVTGEPLTDILRKKSCLPEQQAIQVALQVCAALTTAGQRGVLMRDITSTDLSVHFAADDIPEVKIIDFSSLRKINRIADQRHMVDLGHASSGDDFISRSPEEFKGRAADARSDVYSVGVLLFQCLTGKPPFSGSSYAEMANKHLNDRVPLFSSLRPDLNITPNLESVVQKCLSKQAELRYQTASELQADLYRIVNRQIPLAVSEPKLTPPQLEYLRGQKPGQKDNTAMWVAGITAVLLAVPIILANRMPQKLDLDLFLDDPKKGGGLEAPGGLSPLPLLRKAEELDAKGNEAQATRFYVEAAEKARSTSDPQTATQTLLRVAEIMRGKENYAQSEALAREAAAIASDASPKSVEHTQSMCLVATILADREKFREAQAALDLASRTASERGKILISGVRAQVLELEGKTADAEKLLQETLPKSKEAGMRQDVVHQLACMLIRHGQFQEAQAVLTPEITGAGPIQLACDLITALLHQDKIDDAAQLAKALSSQDIGDYHLRTQVCRLNSICLAMQKKYPEAEQGLETYASKSDSDGLAAAIDLASIYAVAGDGDKAKKILDEIDTRTDFQQFLLASARAKVLLAAGHTKLAERAAQMAQAAYGQSVKKDNLALAATLAVKEKILTQTDNTAALAELKKQLQALPSGPIYLDPADVLLVN